MTLLESTWTVSRDDCRHPARWHATDDESTELEVTELVAAFVRALQPDVVVESGTAFGQTAEAIGRALVRNGQGTLWTWEPDFHRAAVARERCGHLPVRVVEAAFGVPFPAPIGFAWIDGHIDLRVADLEVMRPYLAVGAIVGVHDTGPQHPVRARLEAVPWLRLIHLPTPRGVVFGEVLA